MVSTTDASRSRRLLCLIEGESIVFSVTVGRDILIDNLKKAIQSERALDTLKDVGPQILELWKVDIDLETHNIDFLSQLKVPNHDALRLWTSVLQHWTDQPPLDHLHVIVKAPAAVSSQSAKLSSSDNDLLAKLRQLHMHLWGKDRIVYNPEMACQILDLKLFDVLGLNLSGEETLLIRNDYVSAYDFIRTETLRDSKRPSATLVTGQPGIGKTLFLFYVLARRLHEQGSVAFQINAHKITMLGAWALSDSESGTRYGLCHAFMRPEFHVIHTSPPSSSHWKSWVKVLGAKMYIMDMWALEEFQTLLNLERLDFADGKCLYEKYGPSPRIILEILRDRSKEDLYEEQIQAAAYHLATQFPVVFPALTVLNFGDNISSNVIMVRSKKTEGPHRYTLEIPTSFLCRALSLAISRLAAGQQHAFFRMFSTFPPFRDSAGRLFEEYAHSRLSDPSHEPFKAHCLNGPTDEIPVPAKIIAGSTALKRIQRPHNFYWRPVKSNFKGIDAIIRSEDDVWALQYTISEAHKSATDGLLEIRNGMNHITNVKWHLVMVGSDLESAMKARNNQKLGNEWKWPTVVYASKLPMGQFNEQHVEDLDTILNEANDTDQRPDSDKVMDESL